MIDIDNTIYLQGTIGYTIFMNEHTKKKIIVFADMHDNLPPCPYTNSMRIDRWLHEKIKTSKILLEEVFINNNKLKSLWDLSEHTNALRKFYYYNKNIVEAIDIRPELIPFNWEVVNDSDNKNIKLKKYVRTIFNFLKLETDFIIDKIMYINNNLENHLNNIIDKFHKYLIMNEKLLNKSIIHIFNTNNNILEDFNIILNDCMEWYICLLIEIYKEESLILHAGLYHTEIINRFLEFNYNYKKIYSIGINNLKNKENYKCQPINNNII
jgi:hypothetical protein